LKQLLGASQLFQLSAPNPQSFHFHQPFSVETNACMP
jgi:uncharacterized protein YqcC (DUF446 family)